MNLQNLKITYCSKENKQPDLTLHSLISEEFTTRVQVCWLYVSFTYVVTNLQIWDIFTCPSLHPELQYLTPTLHSHANRDASCHAGSDASTDVSQCIPTVYSGARQEKEQRKLFHLPVHVEVENLYIRVFQIIVTVLINYHRQK